MSTINWAFETPALPQPFQVVIDTAATWLRNVRKAGRNILGLCVNIDYMDDEEFLDLWARSQDSAFLSVLYSVKRAPRQQSVQKRETTCESRSCERSAWEPAVPDCGPG